MAQIPYVKNPTWADGSGGGTSIDAADLNVIENGIFELSSAPAVRAWAGAVTSCTNATYTSQALNSEDFDQAANAASTMHDTVTNNSRLTCRYAGVYIILAGGFFATSTGGNSRLCRFFYNNTTQIGRGGSVYNPVANANIPVTLAAPYKLAVNDFVEFQCFQDSGGALNFTTDFFGMVRVG